jgi:hypothetical protein
MRFRQRTQRLTKDTEVTGDIAHVEPFVSLVRLCVLESEATK